MKSFYFVKSFFLIVGILILPYNFLHAQCDITINVNSSSWGDETTWTLVDNLGNTVLSGGPYGNGYSDSQSIFGASNGPYTLNINASGFIGDNSPNYQVFVNSNLEFSGNVPAGTNVSIGPISCNSGCVSAPVPDDACYQQVINDDPFCCDVSWDFLCQNDYDDCNTPPIPDPCDNIITIGGCQNPFGGTVSGTGSWSLTDCWFGGTPGVELIFAYTPTTSGVHSIEVLSVTGGYVDFFWKPASAGCDATGWNCIQDVWLPGTYGSMSWTSGETYYILVDPEGTGAYDYTFQLLCPNPDPVNASDCEDAVSVCTDLNFTIAPSGYGNIDELCIGCISNPSTNPASGNDGCLHSGELNSTWMVINIEISGVLEFSFGDGVGANCYDWIMWPYDENTCDNIIANNLAPVRCNWNVPCESLTGIGTVPSGGSPGNYEPSLPVTAGQQFIVLFSNWSSVETDVPLNFTGSAVVNCVPLPVELLFFTGEPINDYSILTWETGAEINNSHFEIERSYNGVDFVKIAEVQGYGTVTHTSSYSYTDKKPQQGVNYYRLKQVDYDGKFEYSEIISVLHKGSKFFDLLKLYPNPGTEVVNLEMLLTESSYLNFMVMDQFGRSIINFNQMVSSGVSTVEFNVSRLASGIYSVQVASRDGMHRETIKLVVKNKN